MLEIITSGSPNDRWVAARKFLELDQEAPAMQLLDIFLDGSVDVKRAVLFIVGKVKNGEQHSEVLIKGLKHENDNVFRTACETARNLRFCSVATLVAKGLNSQSTSKIRSALFGLEYAWVDDCFDPVFKLYKKHPSIEVKKAAGYSLKINVSKESWSEIFNAFSKDGIDQHRIWACVIAYKYGDHNIIDALQKLETDENGHVRWHAEKASRRINENEF
jgi:HEAT repeat protein